MHDSDSLYMHMQNKLQKQNSSSSNGSIASIKKSSTSINELSPRNLIIDRTKNRSILKEMLKDIRSSQANSLNSNNSYNEENEILVLRKTESGAIILNEDESLRATPKSDYYEQNDEVYEHYSEVQNESDDEDVKRLESFYNKEGSVEHHHHRSLRTNSRPSSSGSSRVFSGVSSSSSALNSINEDNKRPKSATSSVNLIKNEGNDDRQVVEKKLSLKDDLKNEEKKEIVVHDPLDHLEIKYSTPIPPSRSAPGFRRRIAYKKFLQKFNTVHMMNVENKSVEKDEVAEKVEVLPIEEPQIEEKKEHIENLPEANSTIIESENKYFAFNDEISEIESEGNEEEEDIEEKEQSEDESLSPFMVSNTSNESSLSNYYIKELMGDVSELTLVDPDIFDAVKPVMDKMLKAVCRKCYLHSVGKFKPELDGSNLIFFNKDDHLYDNKMVIATDFNDFDLEQNADNESSTEISESASNDYFSYLKLNLNEEYDETDEPKHTRNISISSEDSSLLDSDERRNLNMQLKDEFNLMKFFILNTKLPSVASKIKEIKKSLELRNNENNTRILHDDYFLSEYDENRILLNAARKRDSIFRNQNADTTKQQLNQQNKNLISKGNQNSKKPYNKNNRVQIEKENLVKRREGRIKQMQKIFQPPKKAIEITELKTLEKYKKPNLKSNIKVKMVPIDYKEPKSRLPEIKSAKSLPERRGLSSAYRSERAKTAPTITILASGPIDERQKYPRPSTSKQPWGTIHHPPYGLGYQRMTDYEIKQSVSRLYYVPKKSNEQLRSLSCLPKEDFYDMIDRLTFGSSDKAADRCRTQEASMYRDMGVLNSYAWKGYYTSQKF